MEAYRENTRPITPPSDHHTKRTSGNYTGAAIPNLEYVDQTLPTTATSYPTDKNRSSPVANNKHSEYKSSGYPPALKNVDAIDPTFSPNLRNTTNEDGFLGRNAPQHNLSPNSVPKSQGTTSMNSLVRGENENNSSNRVINNQRLGSQRNETTRRIEREVYQILRWENPVRSGIALCATVSSTLLTRWYSPLQITAAGLTLSTLINVIYVNFMVQGQKVISNKQTTSHPYDNVIQNEDSNYINRNSVNHFTTVFVEVAETVIRALTRIIFVEDTITSLKWMSIFFLIWKVSAHVATMDIILVLGISAFVFPRLYMSNKDVVDAHIQKSQHVIQNGLNKAQVSAERGVKDAYGKARAYVAQVGTTGTDAKNSMNNTSATVMDQ